MSRLPSLACVALSALAACVRSGAGARSGRPIDARDQALGLVTCQALLGEEHLETEVVATTWRGLNPKPLGSRTGAETGVRAHPLDADVVVFARQLRSDDFAANELFLASLRGAFADVRLTRDGAADIEPCFSSDGQHVLFASNRGGAFQLWQIDRDGSGLRPVTEAAAGQADREPDARGDRIVFSRTTTTTSATRAVLWTMNADGSGAMAITAGIMGQGSATFAPGDHEPALAPDGSSVVFARRTTDARATLFRLEFATQRLVEVLPNADGEDRLPRFLPQGNALLFARTAPAQGMLGRRLVTCDLDGTDLAQLTLDARLAVTGADVLAGAGPWPTPAAQSTPSELETDDARIVLGQRTLGRFELVRSKDSAGLQLATVAHDGKEVAGVFLPFKLNLPEATDVTRAEVRATFALTEANAQARVRISVKDYVRKRFDVAWDAPVTHTRFVDVAFAFTSLAHVDRDGWIRVEIAAELPPGQRAEFALDAVTVAVFDRAR
jgi:dipeptidyl aminopeptidase/acylaminoacyl peptidase